MAGLKTYWSKRRFDVTAEPRGKAAQKRGHAFVMQKHAATRLHYDLRLELDGVMKSWAVTRGPSLVPGEKRLAVEVEDHPIEYNKFEGTIPQGQYGGGTVMIWDRGTWAPDHDPHRGLAKGHLDFHIDGERLAGGWHLVRMRRRPGEKRNNWLLIKSDDDAARTPKDKDILEENMRSVVTRRTMDEIAAGNRVWQSNRKPKTTTPKAKAPARKAKATSRKTKTTTRKTKTMRKRKTAALRAKTAVRRSAKSGDALPPFVEPCLATLSDKAPNSDNWIHEIKFDGYRLQARIDHGEVKLLTRKGLDWTGKFQTTARALAKLPVETAMIDGELVVEGPDGVSSFSLLQQALKDGADNTMVFYVFDLLHLDGEDWRDRPLEARKEALAGLMKRQVKDGPLRLSESFEVKGSDLHANACRLGLEGIISKLRDGPYRSGRGNDWLKTKCSDRQELVIAGYSPSTADAHAIGALSLGYYDNGELIYAGRVGTGYTHKLARDLYRKLKPFERQTSPFKKLPPEERGKNRPIWLEPKFVAEVNFHGWTHGDIPRVRQASFQGLREDKKATEVVREEKKTLPARARTGARKSAKIVRGSAKKSNDDVTFGKVKLSHPDRVYWDDAGVTKRDLAEHYEKVWDWMRPHVTGRVLALVRCPDGADGQCFFQKHASAGIDAKLLRMVSEPDGDKSIAIDDLDGLIALAQAGSLEVHMRGSTIDRLEEANRLIFDLDPGPGVKWPALIEAAREVRARLAALKLESFLKTTGGKGLHVVLPIKHTPWEEAKGFARALAESMERDDPKRFVSTAKKSQRNNRIFVDYLRNSREATAVAPYSTRARPGAPVAVPIAWAELSKLPASNQYTVQNIGQRLSRLRKDPWADLNKLKQPLPRKAKHG